jgi:hypothetical protein
MIDAFGLLSSVIVCVFRARRTLLLENLALRQQFAALKRRHPRPRLVMLDKLFWVLARRFSSGLKDALIVVTPETVVRWHRAGFRMYGKLITKARRPIGRKQTPKQVRELIFRMVAENPTWGAPRIHRSGDLAACINLSSACYPKLLPHTRRFANARDQILPVALSTTKSAPAASTTTINTFNHIGKHDGVVPVHTISRGVSGSSL